MANRFPLVIDTADGNKIKEIPSGDNLDLRNVSISDVQNINALGIINAAAITINGQDLDPGTFLDLSDVPDSYQGFANYSVRVNSSETGLEFYQIGTGQSLLVDNLTVSGSIRPQSATIDIGASANPFQGIYGNFFQGSIKGNDGSVVFDGDNNQIPYSVIVGGPVQVSDLTNDAEYVTRTELTNGSLTVEFNNTGDLTGNVIAADLTVLVDSTTGRINAARLSQNGANNGQTLVWNNSTQLWEPGTAGDITGFSSNKTDTLTVQDGYKIVFAGTTGRFEGDIIAIVPTTRVDIGDAVFLENIAPQDDQGGNIGTALKRFNEGHFTTLNAGSLALTGGGFTGNVTGNLTGNATGNHSGSFVGTITATGTLDGDLVGSVFADDSSVIIDAIDKKVSADIQFTTGTGSITGSTISINATNRVDQSDTQFLGNIFPENNLGGSVGTLAKRWGAGFFDVFSANSLAIEAIEATEVTTSDFNIQGQGVGRLTSTTDLELTAANRIKMLGAPMRLPPITNTERGLIVPLEADVIYNSTDSKIQFYTGGAWVNLHSGTFDGNVNTAAGQSDFNDVVIAGNLTVSGTTTSVNTTNTEISDNVIVLNSGETGAGITNTTSGIEVERGTESNVTFVYDDSVDKWTIGSETLVAGTVEAALTGNVTGDTDGYHTGDVKGSVFADDSTILVDAVNAIIPSANLSGALPALDGSNLTNVTAGAIDFTNITNKPTTISGYGITDAFDGVFTSLTSIPTSLSGYGITDTVVTSVNGVTPTAGGGAVSIASTDLSDGTSIVKTVNGVSPIGGAVVLTIFDGDVAGSVFADDSTLLVDGVAGKLVGDYENGTSVINSTSVTSYDLVALQDANINDLYVSNKIYGGATGSIKNVAISSTAPSTSIGAAGDREGMIAFDATYMYYCTADYDGAANVWKRVAWSVDTW
jgi:hypothetical protein